MAIKIVEPTTVTADHVVAELDGVVGAVTEMGPAACQRWLSACFRTFRDYEHIDPYLPLIPNETDIGKCLLLLALVQWAGRLQFSALLEFAVTAKAKGVETNIPCHIVVSPPEQRLDAATRAAVVALSRDAPSAATIVGIAFGGLGDVEAVTKSFSVVRGGPTRNAARGSGLAIGWIDADALFAAFAANADEGMVKERIRDHFDEAMTRALEAAA
jgi:hypothetical protein